MADAVGQYRGQGSAGSFPGTGGRRRLVRRRTALTLFGSSDTLGDFRGLGSAVVTVTAGEVRGERIEVPHPGTEPVPEHPQRIRRSS